MKWGMETPKQFDNKIKVSILQKSIFLVLWNFKKTKIFFDTPVKKIAKWLYIVKQDILVLRVTSVVFVMNYRYTLGEVKESLSTVSILNTGNLF